MSRSLVIYFSHIGENYINGEIKNINKGNTEVVAEKISKMTKSDIFKVEPLLDYPKNYRECCDVAKKELNSNFRPKLKKYIDSIDNYDTIYIGGPVWWGHYPCLYFLFWKD